MSQTLTTPDLPTPHDSFALDAANGAGADGLESSAESKILSIEGVALQNGLLPIQLMRESCSPEAEKAVRRLGRVPYVADPWLPVTTLGPLVIMAHHNPRASDLWGIPACFVVRVIISQDQYQTVRKDLVQRFSQSIEALKSSGAIAALPRCLVRSGLRVAAPRLSL